MLTGNVLGASTLQLVGKLKEDTEKNKEASIVPGCAGWRKKNQQYGSSGSLMRGKAAYGESKLVGLKRSTTGTRKYTQPDRETPQTIKHAAKRGWGKIFI